MEKFKKRLTLWKARMLSIGERLTMVKAILNNLSMYYMSLFRMPDLVIEKLEKLRNKFL